MKAKDTDMIKYGVDESELDMEKTAGRVVVPDRYTNAEATDPRIKIPWNKRKGKGKKKAKA